MWVQGASSNTVSKENDKMNQSGTSWMEGTLWKWTNYFSGWQSRWFILDNGILSYYKSQDDVENGCKGSINMSVCDVIVHPTDASRIDLIIPGEQHYYVKACTPQERQTWLVALGSCKACLADGKGGTIGQRGETTVVIDGLKAKKSELRLYCDLMMQQVHSVKQAISKEDGPDAQQLEEATPLLSATCDIFIKTLEACMSMAEEYITMEVPTQLVVDGSLSSPSPTSTPTGMPFTVHGHLKKPRTHRSGSIDKHSPRGQKSHQHRHNLDSLASMTTYTKQQSISSSGTSSNSPTDHPNTSAIKTHEWNPLYKQAKEETNGRMPEGEGDEAVQSRMVHTFFSNMKPSFQDIKLAANGGIPVQTFLQSCKAVVSIFDKLSSTAFAPVKMDISGNIRKINEKYKTNPSAFSTLQAIVLYEKSVGQSQLSNSATQALLWLKRALHFIKEFLGELVSGEQDLTKAATKAYERSLKPYHGWVVRGVFSLAAKAAPYREEFLKHLAASRMDQENPDFETLIIQDMDECSSALEVLISILSDFYISEDLDSQEQV
ncbi:pleckstrin homology domain-containing family A member 8 [Lingula anatina]|uniref:Pleckstrin homology domain-containing family A member 8 n=2 Tax=Lingula anatina TaxID=7574 RepID=A0A1S3H6Z8_LINAN|nr:pleckstrin homology domain-containing family A member 8 [Lingula anatina]|eukprot:XP_013381773.1 pleckstrin homology domain-containing family A member 8 [Lingula anatina]